MRARDRDEIDRSNCSHEEIVVQQSAGLERKVCIACGEVNVTFVSELTGDLDRSTFARPADNGVPKRAY